MAIMERPAIKNGAREIRAEIERVHAAAATEIERLRVIAREAERDAAAAGAVWMPAAVEADRLGAQVAMRRERGADVAPEMETAAREAQDTARGAREAYRAAQQREMETRNAVTAARQRLFLRDIELNDRLAAIQHARKNAERAEARRIAEEARVYAEASPVKRAVITVSRRFGRR